LSETAPPRRRITFETAEALVAMLVFLELNGYRVNGSATSVSAASIAIVTD
jgi:hypothetical protein